MTKKELKKAEAKVEEFLIINNFKWGVQGGYDGNCYTVYVNNYQLEINFTYYNHENRKRGEKKQKDYYCDILFKEGIYYLKNNKPILYSYDFKAWFEVNCVNDAFNYLLYYIDTIKDKTEKIIK